MPAETSIPVSADALVHSQRVSAFLRAQLQEQGGWLPFSQWMHHVLYAPGLGYYAAGSVKLAEATMATLPHDTQSDAQHSNGNSNSRGAISGDFVTAPQLTPLFGYTLAGQALEVLQQADSTDILEFGAGSGALAHSVLSALDSLGVRVVRY